MGQPRSSEDEQLQGVSQRYPLGVLQDMGLAEVGVGRGRQGAPSHSGEETFPQGSGHWGTGYSTTQHPPSHHRYHHHHNPHHSHRMPGLASKRSGWNNKTSSRVPTQIEEEPDVCQSPAGNSLNLHAKKLSYESLGNPYLDSNKTLKRHHHYEAFVPPYPPPGGQFYQHYGQEYGPEFMTSAPYQPFPGFYSSPHSHHPKRRQFLGRPNHSSAHPRFISTIAPDRFLHRAHLVHISSTPSALLSGGKGDKLSQEIWDRFMANQQTEQTYRRKMLLWRQLYVSIKNVFPRYGLYLVGSTMSGFGSDSSDVDMCLLVRPSDMDQRSEAVIHLELVRDLLRRSDLLEQVELIQAKVPILKFRDAYQGLEVDLNCNNAVGIRNTHLLFCYANLDWRVRPLVLLVKLWAQHQGINDAKNMTISSYSLALMVINFLQCGVSPPVLPCLQQLYPEKFHSHSLIQHIDIHEELPSHPTDNFQSLGELLLGFLEYYTCQFDFGQEAASVRTAARVPIEECRQARSYKNDAHQWKYLCIEEPFELTNTARSVYDREVFERVKLVFNTSYRRLKSSLSLESIFNQHQKSVPSKK